MEPADARPVNRRGPPARAVFPGSHDEVAAGRVRRLRCRQRRSGGACRCATSRREAGRVTVTTVFDLIMAQFGVPRVCRARYPAAATMTMTCPTRRPGRRSSPASTAIRWCASPASGPTNAEKTQRQEPDHHRRGGQPLVSQQPALPLGDRGADADRLRGRQRRRPGALRRAGEAGQPGLVEHDRLRQ